MKQMNHLAELESRIATFPFGLGTKPVSPDNNRELQERLSIFERAFPRMGSILRNQSGAAATFTPNNNAAESSAFDAFLVIPEEGPEWAQVWVGTLSSVPVRPSGVWNALPEVLTTYFSDGYGTFTYSGESGGPFPPHANLVEYFHHSTVDWWPTDAPQMNSFYPIMRTVGTMPKLYCISTTDNTPYLVDAWAHSFDKNIVQPCGPLNIEIDKYMSEGVDLFEG